MTKKIIKSISESLSVLIGLPLRAVTRSGPSIYFNFGDLVKVNGIVLRDENGIVLRDENGQVLYEQSLQGKYALDTLCAMRFICGNEVIFAKSDIFLPTNEQFNKEGFVWDTFDWHTVGNSLFDELLDKHFCGDFNEYFVKSVKVGRFGDLIISFNNNFVFEFFADSSGYSENWRFGEIDSTDSLVVSSKGIIDEALL